MVIHHHPSESLLLDYASGALSEAWSLAIACHLTYCPACRQDVARLEALGGALLHDITPDLPENALAAENNIDFDRLGAPMREPTAPASSVATKPVLPLPLRQYLGGDLASVRWRGLGIGAQQFPIEIASDTARARLLRIPAGKPVPHHGHNGLELTLVLKGAYRESTGHYGPGDLQEADAELSHQPQADPEGDCICLAVTDAPLRFHSVPARMAQIFLDI